MSLAECGAEEKNKSDGICIEYASRGYRTLAIAKTDAKGKWRLAGFIALYNPPGRILHGSPDFFIITKKFHNALQGERINLSDRKKEMYHETNRCFSVITHIEDHDLVVVVHDPQPLPLIDFYEKKQQWIFRCHVDLSNPNRETWNYMRTYVEKYDRFVVSREEYKKRPENPAEHRASGDRPFVPQEQGTVRKGDTQIPLEIRDRPKQADHLAGIQVR
ncbi:MAG: hypothetical protein WAX07_01300 [Candidatus Altiarchaeia archaeon]